MRRRLVLAFLIGCALVGGRSAAEDRVCVEEAAGVCLKYRAVAPVSPAPQPTAAERRERDLGLTRADRRAVQRGLRDGGFYSGAIDGLYGAGTRKAIARWQRANGAAPDGYLSAEAVRTLSRAESRAAAPTPGPSSSGATKAEIAEAIHGLGCKSMISGELANLVFNRSGRVVASAPDVALNVTWALERGSFCIRNFGQDVHCGTGPADGGDKERLRAAVRGVCGG